MHRIVNWGLLLATLVSVLGIYALKYDTRQLEATVFRQERALEKLENDVTVLQAERAHLARPEALEPLARGLGMVPLDSRQYLRAEVADPPRVPASAEKKTAPAR